MFLGLQEEIERSPAVRRREILRWVGETGRAEEAALLGRLLMQALEEGDEKYQLDLVSALTGLGGKESVEALLCATEEGSEQVSVGALAGLEDLASIGADALTEAATPRLVPKNSEEWKYVENIDYYGSRRSQKIHDRHPVCVKHSPLRRQPRSS